MMDNPLLNLTSLPRFSQIKPEHIVPAIDHLLTENRKKLTDLLKKQHHYSWDNLIAIMEDMDDQLNRTWSPVSHLHSVADNDALRTAFNTCLPKLSEYSTELGQNSELYGAYLYIFEGKEYPGLSTAQKSVIQHALREFRLSGVALEEEKKNEFKEIQQRLSSLQTRFEENLLDATHAWKKHITDKSLLSGLPESVLSLAAQTARQEDLEGWLFTLDFPSYMPVMKYADHEPLREEMYHAYVTRASDQGPGKKQWDNTDIMQEILELRHRMACLLDYTNYAEYSLARKMASGTDEVMQFLTDLAEKTRKVAQQEMESLIRFARDTTKATELKAWDIAYYSEKLKQHSFNLTQEELRPYFPVDQVLEGMFAVVNRLYNLEIKPRSNVDTWHPDVRFYDIYDQQQNLQGSFYLDLYARAHKRGGAWMDECVVRRKTLSGIQTPVAFLTCNFTPPVNSDPSLLTHDEVTTLFHEFGHGLHHMLTKVDYAGVSGINGVPWDAVELPSQFMENWCWERDSLDLIGKHYKTGEPVHEDLFKRLSASRSFQAGMQMVRQLEFAIFDFRLHLEYDPKHKPDIQTLIDEVRNQVAVVIPPEYNRFQHSFSHIFAGGYAAGYYSYKWAEVLSADAFSKFEENGIFDKKTGNEFKHSILEQGGTRDPMDLFIEFRGRKPSIEPLLRHTGIAA